MYNVYHAMKTKPLSSMAVTFLEAGGKALHLASLHFFANLPPLFSFSQLAVSMSCPRCLKSIIVSAGDFFGWLPSFSSLFWFLTAFWQRQPFYQHFILLFASNLAGFFFSFGCFRQGLLAFCIWLMASVLIIQP